MSASARVAPEIRKLDIEWVRRQFPALRQTVNGRPAVFFDAPGGTQVPQRVIDAISDYLSKWNANLGGAFLTSQRTELIVEQAHQAMADFFNCAPEEVIFGANMTTLTFALSRAIGRELKSGDELLVTGLDHDANVSPWVYLEARGAKVRTADIKPGDCTLDMFDMQAKIRSNTRVVALGWAANAVGTINDVREAVRMAHAVGAMTFIDAVHYAPHGSIDVQALDCDFLVCSPYKFFGPHMGALYGKREHLERLRPYKVRPCTEQVPDRWESGTQVHELIAGIGAAVEYIAALGRRSDGVAPTRREALVAAYRATVAHERRLISRLIEGVQVIPGVRIYGITDPNRFSERCSTLSLRIGNHHPTAIATFLGERGIFTWDGNYYALNLTERLGVESLGGLLRVGLVHYNTMEEVERLLGALREFASK